MNVRHIELAPWRSIREPLPEVTVVKEPAKLNLSDYLPYLVNRVGMIIADQFGAETLAPHQLSIAMWRVMVVLAANGSQRQIDLADLTSIDASTLSRIVTRLVHLGSLARTRSASSNREVTVTLSAKGHGLVTRLIPFGKSIEAEAIAGLSADELAVLRRCLRRMYSNIKARPAATRTARNTKRAAV